MKHNKKLPGSVVVSSIPSLSEVDPGSIMVS